VFEAAAAHAEPAEKNQHSTLNLEKAVTHEVREETPRKPDCLGQDGNNLLGESSVFCNLLNLRETSCPWWI